MSKVKRATRLVAGSLAVAVATCVVLPDSWAGEQKSETRHFSILNVVPSYRTTDEPFVFHMGDNWFAVPLRYISSRRLPPDGAEMPDGIVITVLWPGLEPFSAQNASEFRLPGFGRRLRIRFAPQGPQLLGDDLWQARFKHADKTSARQTNDGYLIYDMATRYIGKQLFVKYNTKNDRFFMLCAKIVKGHFPYCNIDNSFNEGLLIHISFSRDFASDAVAIRDQVLDLFESFRIPGPPAGLK